MKIMICGSRSDVNPTVVLPRLHAIISKMDSAPIILHGGAKGVDTMASNYAKDNGITEIVVRPNYKSYHYRLAPIIRNTEMVNQADVVICIWGNNQIKKGGTYDVYKKAIAKNLKVIEILPSGSERITFPLAMLF